MNGCMGKRKTNDETKDEIRMMRNGAMLLEESIAWFNGKRNPIRSFSAKEIEGATNNYDPSCIFHDGGYNVLYEGSFQGFPVCVKKFAEQWEEEGLKKAITDTVVSSRMSNHNNVLKLRGCCLETEIPTLVLEFPENGSLEKIIYGFPRRSLSWKCRIRIAANVANAIIHLHTAFPRPIVHMGIKPSSILLNQNDVAKLSDFSRSISIPDGETHAQDNIISGTFSYAAPEYIKTGFMSEKTDVFAFGVCLLVLLTGKKAYNCNSSRRLGDLVTNSTMNERLDEIVDPAILGEERWPGKPQQLRDFAALALKCTFDEEEGRPMMIDVAKQLRLFEQSTP